MREVRDVMRIAQQPVSLEKPVGEEDDSALADFVEDVSAESPFEIASEALRRENITRVLASLPRREREVIEMRYGIVGGRSRTLEEVGRAFNITRERVRQIENRTLKKLQTLPDAQQLREALLAASRGARRRRLAAAATQRSPATRIPSQPRTYVSVDGPLVAHGGRATSASSRRWSGSARRAIRRSLPVGHSPDYDLIADDGEALLRVQVKTSTHLRQRSLESHALHPRRQPELERHVSSASAPRAAIGCSCW